MAGRPPKPTKLLELKGTAQKCRHAKRKGEAKPREGFPDAPAWLLPEGKAEWDRISAAYAGAGVLTQLDRGMLATYCQMWGRFVEAERATPYAPLPASFISTMASVANKLGLDPSGRARLTVLDDKPKDASPWDALPGLQVISGGKTS